MTERVVVHNPVKKTHDGPKLRSAIGFHSGRIAVSSVVCVYTYVYCEETEARRRALGGQQANPVEGGAVIETLTRRKRFAGSGFAR